MKQADLNLLEEAARERSLGKACAAAANLYAHFHISAETRDQIMRLAREGKWGLAAMVGLLE